MAAFLNSREPNVVVATEWDGAWIDLTFEGENDGEACLFLEDISDSKILSNYRWAYTNHLIGLIITSELNPDTPFEKVYDFLIQEHAAMKQLIQEAVEHAETLRLKAENESGE